MTIDLSSSPLGPKRNLKRSLSVDHQQPSTSSATPCGGGGKKKKAGTSPKPPERKWGQTSHQKGAEKTRGKVDEMKKAASKLENLRRAELESTTARLEKTLRNGKRWGSQKPLIRE